MEKRALVAIALSFFVMIFYWYFIPRQQPKSPSTAVSSEKISTEASTTPTPSKEYGIASLPAVSDTSKEELVELNSPQLRAVISNIGGGLKEVEVKTYHDGEGKPLLLSAQENQFYPLTIAHLGEEDLRATPFQVVRQDGQSVVLKKETPSGLEIVKTIRLRPDQYLFEVDVVLQNKSKKEVRFEEGFDLAVGGILPGGAKGAGAGLGLDAILDNNVLRLAERKFKQERWDYGNIKWAAVKNQFCTFILKPDRFAVGVGGSQFQSKGQTGLSAVLRMEDFGLIAGESKSYHFLFYAGPKEYDTLKAIGHEFDQVMDFGKFLGPFSIFILKSLLWIYGWCHNYGIAIILLTVAIKIVTLPLTHKSFKSMKEMQVIQPHLAELREKHKSNPKKLQTEMMALYKEHRINPLGGCLPLLLQMPILIAFFKTLNNAVELKGAPFFFWIKDLSVPDHLFTLPMGLPILGNAFNLLPLFMVLTFVIQQRMSSAASKGAAVTEQQKQQQKMMQVMMPIIFGVLFYNMPSGLVLYFTVSTLLGLVQQYYVLKLPHPIKVKVNALS